MGYRAYLTILAGMTIAAAASGLSKVETFRESLSSYQYADGRIRVGCAPSPLDFCVVELQPGERVVRNGIHLADAGRWIVMPVMGMDNTTQVMIKPISAGLETSMAMITDRRTYYMGLSAKADSKPPKIALYYPDLVAARWQLLPPEPTLASEEPPPVDGDDEFKSLEWEDEPPQTYGVEGGRLDRQVIEYTPDSLSGGDDEFKSLEWEDEAQEELVDAGPVSEQAMEYMGLAGESLEDLIRKWSKQNGYTVSWDVYTKSGNKPVWYLPADIQISGNYYEVVIRLLRAYRANAMSVKFTHLFYINNVLHVSLEEPFRD